MALAPYSPRRPVPDPLAEQILALIHERGLRAGDPIPTELELIERLSVSRNSVREAIRGLRALGIVAIRHGYAALPALSPSLTFQALADPSGDRLRGLRHLVDIREVVEVGVTDRLAGQLPPETLDRLDALCDQMSDSHLDPDVERATARSRERR